MDDDFIDNTHMAAGEDRETINVNRSGALNRALMSRLTEVSVSNEWDEAKHEWKVTGNVWYIPLVQAPNRLPAHHQESHPQECICGHRIAWHFEVENTENGNLEILGSEHITNWMIIRHLKEVMNIPADAITEERIQEWIKVMVKSMKCEWWWSEYGDDWEEMFNEVKELDLRINVRSKGKYYDNNSRRYEKHWTIAKTRVGSLGKMASVVWRWNHPDNARRQIETRGYPNKKLWRDVQLLWGRMEKMEAEADQRETEYAERVLEIKNKDEERANRVREMANEIREETGEEYDDEALMQACTYYDIPLFSLDIGVNDWERRFLNDMRNRLINRRELSEKQLNALMRIIEPNAEDVTLASVKQIRYIVKLGGEPPENLSKRDASKMISELMGN